MFELAGNHLGAALKTLEVFRLHGHFEVARAREVARNAFRFDDLRHAIDGGERCGVQAASHFESVTRDQRFRAFLQSR